MSQEVVFGIHAVEAFINRHSSRVKELWVNRDRSGKRLHLLLERAQEQGISVEFKEKSELDAICAQAHQGVVALVSSARAQTEQDLYELLDKAGPAPFILILDGITDPRNLGACLRSANAAGVQAVVVPKDNSAGITDVTRKVACGAAESTPLIAVTNLARTMKKLQELGVWIIGTCGEADLAIFDAPLTGPLAIVMGAEGTGMRRLTREHCDYLAFIPMSGDVSSLNVSVAAGVCLFEAVRQRRQPL